MQYPNSFRMVAMVNLVHTMKRTILGMKKIILLSPILSIGMFLTPVTNVLAYTSTQKILVELSHKNDATFVEVYHQNNKKKMVNTHRHFSIFNKEKTRIRIVDAQKVKINGATWWEVGPNQYIKNERVNVVK